MTNFTLPQFPSGSKSRLSPDAPNKVFLHRPVRKTAPTQNRTTKKRANQPSRSAIIAPPLDRRPEGDSTASLRCGISNYSSPFQHDESRMTSPLNLEALQTKIGYHFRNPALLRESLVHPSYLQEQPEEPANNQRLEFLGDAVLDLILSEKLFHLFPHEREGTLSKQRSILAKGLFLSDLAKQLRLHESLFMSRSELKNGGNLRPSSLEDAFEALVGALYLDSDLPTTRTVVLQWYGDLPEHLRLFSAASNPKGRLQELVQPTLGNDALRYETSREEGEAHHRFFEVQLFLQNKLLATGEGRTKKEAEEQAATSALKNWTKLEK
jgi:ribonuclease III